MSTIWHDTYQEPARELPVSPEAEPGDGIGLSFFAQLGIHLGNLVDELRKTNGQLQRTLDRIPYDTPILGEGVTNSSGLAVISCNGPSLGRQWQVRQLGVIGPTTGSVTFFACPAPPIHGQRIGFKDSTKTRWPAPGFYSTHQFIVNPPEYVFVVVATATHTVQVVVQGTAETYALEDYRVTEVV